MFLYFEFEIGPRSHIKWSYFQFYFNCKRNQTCFTCFENQCQFKIVHWRRYTILSRHFQTKRYLHTDTNLICKNVFTDDHFFDICMSYAKHFMLIAQCKLCSHFCALQYTRETTNFCWWIFYETIRCWN